MRPIRPAAQRRFELAAPSVLEVVTLEKGGPAEKAGIREGDILLGLEGQSVASVDDVHRLLTDVPAGSHIKLKMLRENELMEVEVVTGEL